MKKKLEQQPVIMSAPCRLDFGGTLDISTFYFPLRQYFPATFNIAIDMRTFVRLLPFKSGYVKISSIGFKTIECKTDQLPFNHPMGLIFAIAAYFGADGVHIDIGSSSPPKSALGGSSVAAVALISAFLKFNGGLDDKKLPIDEIVLLAHFLESSVARVPCGIQDQLAAAYGGVNKWCWTGDVKGLPYKREIIADKEPFKNLEEHFIAAYCGQPHESKDINGKWVDHFLTGRNMDVWKEIVNCCNLFSAAIAAGDFRRAAKLMQKETAIRLKITPEVLDDVGYLLYDTACHNGCGARFTGAGGGGCVWAIGEKDKILALKKEWAEVLKINKNAFLMDLKIDSQGVREE